MLISERWYFSVKSGAQTRLLAIVLAMFTLAALGLAIANLVQESDYTPATDGASWTETTGGLRAYLVPPDTPAYRAGVRTGDILTVGQRCSDAAAGVAAAADRRQRRLVEGEVFAAAEDQ